MLPHHLPGEERARPSSEHPRSLGLEQAPGARAEGKPEQGGPGPGSGDSGFPSLRPSFPGGST